MIFPRFSLRWLLAVTTVSGFLALVLAQAIAGQAWAVAVSVAGGALLLTALLHMTVFVLAWGLAALGSRIRRRRPSSPFATDVAPPQILAPLDPE